MLIKCPVCGKPVSREWLVLGLPWSKYTCGTCQSVLAGTILRFAVNTVVIAVVGFFAIKALKGSLNPLLLLPMFAVAAILFLFNLPGQIKRMEEGMDGKDNDRD